MSDKKDIGSTYTSWSKIGTIVAGALSYTVNKSIGWMIFHMCCGWFYALYWGFKYGRVEEWINLYLR